MAAKKKKLTVKKESSKKLTDEQAKKASGGRGKQIEIISKTSNTCVGHACNGSRTC